MLVLSRRQDEAIHIGPDVVVRVLGVDKNGVVKLGISAPRRMRILREELLSQISDANRSALAGPHSVEYEFPLSSLPAVDPIKQPDHDPQT